MRASVRSKRLARARHATSDAKSLAIASNRPSQLITTKGRAVLRCDKCYCRLVSPAEFDLVDGRALCKRCSRKSADLVTVPRAFILALAERIYGQSELLSQKAKKCKRCAEVTPSGRLSEQKPTCTGDWQPANSVTQSRNFLASPSGSEAPIVAVIDFGE